MPRNSLFSLKSIKLPSTVKIVYDGLENPLFDPFAHYTIEFADGNLDFKTIDGIVYSSDMKRLLFVPENLKCDEFIVPDGIEDIGHVFCSKCGIKRVIVPNTVKKIHKNGFRFSHILSVLWGNETFPFIRDPYMKTT